MEEAGRLFDRALALDPDLVRVLVNAASVDMQEQDWEGAIRLLDRAIEKQPDFAPALGNLAVAYGQLGRTDEAIRTLRTLLRYYPGDLRAEALLDQFLAPETGDDAARGTPLSEEL